MTLRQKHKVLGIFMNCCKWPPGHVWRLVPRNVDVVLIQSVFTTTLNQVQSFQKTRLFVLQAQLDWAEV